MSDVGPTAFGLLLVGALAAITGRHQLEARPANLDDLSLDRPGQRVRLHRDWFAKSAMADLLGEDFALAQKDNLYRCLDKLLEHRQALFQHLRGRWEDLFGVKFHLLLYDLTSTYVESDPPFGEKDKRKFGYSRDKRSDCPQVVIGLW